MIQSGRFLKCKPSSFLLLRMCHQHQRTRRSRNKYSEHFRTLELKEDASRSAVRQKYIELVKKHHPDTSQDGGEKFSQIDSAYKMLMKKFQEDQIRYSSCFMMSPGLFRISLLARSRVSESSGCIMTTPGSPRRRRIGTRSILTSDTQPPSTDSS